MRVFITSGGCLAKISATDLLTTIIKSWTQLYQLLRSTAIINMSETIPQYDDFLITAPLRRDNFEVGPQDEFTDLEHAIDHLRAVQSTELYIKSFVERDLSHSRITEDQALTKLAVARCKVEDAKLNIYSQVANLNRQAPVKRLILLGQEAA